MAGGLANQLKLGARKVLFLAKLGLRIASRAFPRAKTIIPPQDLPQDYDQIIEALQSSNPASLTQIATQIPGFATGHDPFANQPWFITAIDLGSLTAVQWFLAQGVLTATNATACAALTAGIKRSLASDEFADSPENPTAILAALTDAQPPLSVHLNAPDAMGLRPLHIAALLGACDATALLLAKGADPNLTDTATFATPYAHAMRAGQVQTAALLRPAP